MVVLEAIAQDSDFVWVVLVPVAAVVGIEFEAVVEIVAVVGSVAEPAVALLVVLGPLALEDSVERRPEDRWEPAHGGRTGVEVVGQRDGLVLRFVEVGKRMHCDQREDTAEDLEAFGWGR